jgi:endonuclease YncB( thermonuclease family)
MESLLAGRKVFLERDLYQPARDEHGRLLAHVYGPDGTDVGAELIRRGYARAYRKFRYGRKDVFIRFEDEARRARRGLWLRGSP